MSEEIIATYLDHNSEKFFRYSFIEATLRIMGLFLIWLIVFSYILGNSIINIILGIVIGILYIILEYGNFIYKKCVFKEIIMNSRRFW